MQNTSTTARRARFEKALKAGMIDGVDPLLPKQITYIVLGLSERRLTATSPERAVRKAVRELQGEFAEHVAELLEEICRESCEREDQMAQEVS